MSRATAPGSSCAFVVTCSRHRRRRLTGEPCEPVSVRAHKVTQTAARKGAATAGFTGTGLEPGACKERPLDGCEEPAPPGRGSRARGRLPRARRRPCRRGPAAREPSCAALKAARPRRRRRGARTRRCSNASTRGPLRCTYTYCYKIPLWRSLVDGAPAYRGVDRLVPVPTAAHAEVEVRQPQAETATPLCPPRRGGRSTVHAPHRLSRRRRRRPTCARVLCFVSRSRDGMRTSDPGSSTH